MNRRAVAPPTQWSFRNLGPAIQAGAQPDRTLFKNSAVLGQVHPLKSRNSVPAPMARGITYMKETGLKAETRPAMITDGINT